ncbi:response regulator transcription factor [Synechococcus sp. A10-1-5-1]|uniref:response regulator transcription factor n=1 Tax=Synechococcus sp. A10-1-5-1 TaxID=2936507 RepID=UPI00200135D8|nr:response regulator transcription factor [Synechococcus sp. A10-1-5-1]UPM51173.1 response regulator transcription factor [Synechococcus sp. A10-1-5-1]
MAPGSQATRLLLADDDPKLRQFLELELAEEGYTVQSAATGMDALLAIRQDAPELVILDWMLPDLSGVEVCQRLRSTGLGVPVLMLTGRDAVADRVEALDAGADDYLVKPFSIEELLARLRALARRGTRSEPGLLQIDDLMLNTASHEVSRGGAAIHLSLTEFSLLRELMREPGRVQSREQLLHSVWGEGFVGDSNVLDVYVRYLRRKLEPEGQPTLIQTVRGVGFLLKPGAPKIVAP